MSACCSGVGHGGEHTRGCAAAQVSKVPRALSVEERRALREAGRAFADEMMRRYSPALDKREDG